MDISSFFPCNSNAIFALTLLLLSEALVNSAPTEDSVMLVYEKWISDFGRVYKSNIEKEERFKVFKANYQFIQSIKSQPDLTYTVDLNEFADLTNEEFLTNFAGFKSLKGKRKSTNFSYANLTTVPACIDWRSSGAVTTVKDQGNCGSDWAFSAVGAIESICKIRTGMLVSLSEQELIDCCSCSGGCNGGSVDCAFQCVIQNFNGCITDETNYPYTSGSTGTVGTCNYAKTTNSCACQICSYQDITPYCESCIKNVVVNQPVSASIDARGSAFQFYSSGIFTGPCGTNVNHNVLIVGYGPCATGTPYWIVKNFWGTSWGESGYIRMQRNVANTAGLCGIAIEPSYPILC